MIQSPPGTSSRSSPRRRPGPLLTPALVLTLTLSLKNVTLTLSLTYCPKDVDSEEEEDFALIEDIIEASS